MKSVGIFIVLTFVLSSCTSTRSLSRKFSEKPERISQQFSDAKHANSGERKGYYSGETGLWTTLAMYHQENDTLPEVSNNAVIKLSLIDNKVLKVTAFEEEQMIGSFEIPVRKRSKYLILKSKIKTIPIPLFFSMNEDKAILATLKNGALGYYHYTDETLWILFFGASNTGRVMHEYQPIP